MLLHYSLVLQANLRNSERSPENYTGQFGYSNQSMVQAGGFNWAPVPGLCGIHVGGVPSWWFGCWVPPGRRGFHIGGLPSRWVGCWGRPAVREAPTSTFPPADATALALGDLGPDSLGDLRGGGISGRSRSGLEAPFGRVSARCPSFSAATLPRGAPPRRSHRW